MVKKRAALTGLLVMVAALISGCGSDNRISAQEVTEIKLIVDKLTRGEEKAETGVSCVTNDLCRYTSDLVGDMYKAHERILEEYFDGRRLSGSCRATLQQLPDKYSRIASEWYSDVIPNYAEPVTKQDITKALSGCEVATS